MKRIIGIILCAALCFGTLCSCSANKKTVLTVGEAEIDSEIFAYFFSEAYSFAESNGGETPAWRKVAGLENMDQDAWLAGSELKQDWFNVYKANYRIKFRNTLQTFFTSFQRKDYNGGSLAELINKTNEAYDASKPTENLR